MVWPLVAVYVCSPLLEEWAERDSDPLSIDLLVPEREEVGSGNAVPGKTANVPDAEREHGGACHREEGASPRPVVAAPTKPFEVFSCGPYARSGQVRSALVDGPDLQPHPLCDHFWDELQLGQHLEPRDGVARHRAAPPSVSQEQEAAVDSHLDVVVVVGASQGAAYCTEVCGSGAFGERSDRERQCVGVVVAQACT